MKKSELVKLAQRADKGHKTVLGLPGQGAKLSPEKVKELVGSAPLPSVPEDGFKTRLPEELVNAGGADVQQNESGAKGTQATPAAPEVAAPPAPPAGIDRYVLAKRYSPKTDRNTTTWNRMVEALKDGPKTLAELSEAVKDHKDFVGYMVRNGHIALVR